MSRLTGPGSAMPATIGHRIGADRLGAAVYEAEAGHPIWPYHYHHDFEEWLYVISGAPVLRDAGHAGTAERRRGLLSARPQRTVADAQWAGR